MSLQRRIAAILCTTTVLCVPSARAQVRETWRRIFDFGTPYSADLVHAIALYPTGGYVFAGSTLDSPTQFDRTNPLCVRLDANGNVVWSRSFTGDPQNDFVNALVVAPSGNVYCASSPSFGNHGTVRLLKYDAAGNQSWIGGPYGVGGAASDSVTARALVIDTAESTFIGCTHTLSGATTSDMVVLSYDSAGTQRFATVIDGPATSGDILSALCRDAAGNLFAVGSMDGIQSGSSRFGVVKLDMAGNVQWTRTHVEGPPSNTHSLSAAVCDAAGNLYATGMFGVPTSSLTGVVLSYDPTGLLRWSVPVSGTGSTNPTSIAIDRWGDIVIAAYSGNGGLFRKYDTLGNLLWTREYANLPPTQLAIGLDGDITVGGLVAATAQTDDMVIARLDAAGDLRWYRSIDQNGNEDLFADLVVAADGRVAATGWTETFAIGPGYGPADALTVELLPQARPFCFGDGLGTACPCGNSSPGVAQAGCLNSMGVGGRLRDSGNASIAGDTLVLTATGVPSSTLFFQGTVATAGGAGATFGDGLRCVGGAVVRLHIVAPSGSTASFPSGAALTPIHVAGSTAAGDIRHYQCWYRNAAAFCTPSTFNLTQGLTILWGP